MKNVLCSLAFMLVGSFAFASNGQLKENSFTVQSESTVNTIDYSTFKSMVENQQIKIVKAVDFVFYDSCGGAWHVTGGDGWTTMEVMNFLWEWDGGC